MNLALRNPLDVQPTATSGIRMAALLSPAGAQAVIDPEANKVVRKAPVARAAVPAPAPAAASNPTYRVETIRAAKRGEEEVGQ